MRLRLRSYAVKLEWQCAATLIPYEEACDTMEKRVADIAQGKAPELIWFLEHPPLYTIGTSGGACDILQNPEHLPIYTSGRGGQVTYHGPGQRIGYVLLNLKKRSLSPRAFTATLEAWLQDVLQELGVQSFTDPKRIGVWIQDHTVSPTQEHKIAAIGVRIRHGISFHGFALNIFPDLTAFQHIIPCGLAQFQVTSLEALRVQVSCQEVDKLLQKKFGRFFG